MQRLIAYVSAGETLGAVRDYANAKSATPPTFIRGIGANLHLRLFSDLNSETPYPIGQLENIASWQWLMDSDWNGSTAPKIVADNANITVGEILEMIDDMEYRFTDITIPILDTNTEEIAAWLGSEETMSGLHGQLIGYDSDGAPAFVLQIKNFSIRNRLDSAGTPVVIEPEYLNEAQVRALIVTAVKDNLPSISASDTWVIAGVDTGKTSRGEAGPPGPKGESFKPDAVGLLSERSQYNAEGAGFAYLAVDTALIYFRVGIFAGVWSDGVPLALKGDTGGNGATRYPVTACFGNEVYQIVCYLDATHNMTFAGYIAEPVKKIDLYVVSANTAYTGNIVLKVGSESFTVPVGATVGKVTLPLSTPATGIVSIVRDTANASDTLSDGTDAITAFVVDWSVQ